MPRAKRAIKRHSRSSSRHWLAVHPVTAISYNSLAANQISQGKYAEAETFYQQALAIQLKTLGIEHPDTATSYHGLAANLRPRANTPRPNRYFKSRWRS